MILQSDNLSEGATLSYDVCVIGSGPAGMVVVNELRGDPITVCLLESGQQKRTPYADRLRRVESTGISIKPYSRERILGGTSTTWAGLSSPLDPIDLSERSYCRNSGWPIAYDELLPFYQRASDRYCYPPLDVLQGERFEEIRQRSDLKLDWNDIEEKIFLARTEPTNFGKQFKGIFEKEDGPDCYLDSSLKCLCGGEQTDRIAFGIIRTRSGKELFIQANVFVLAAGGIEDARILLNSRDICEAGLGNGYDQVGRYFMNHPKANFGTLRLNQPVDDSPYYFGSMYRGLAGYAGLRLSDRIQNELQVLNTYVRFEPIYPWSGNRGVEAAVYFVKRSSWVFSSWKRSSRNKVVSLRDYSETGDDSDLQNAPKSTMGYLAMIWMIVSNLPIVLRYGYWRIVARRAPQIRKVCLRNFMEMEPRPENRVTLDEIVDEHGYPVARVEHATSDLDRRSLIALHRVLGEEVARLQLGRLESSEDTYDWNLEDASHHLGATRMGTNPQTSVVDTNCKIHGISNVYLAGGSVFPTSGCSNPTFTISALAIRLAEHLRSSMRMSMSERAGAQKPIETFGDKK